MGNSWRSALIVENKTTPFVKWAGGKRQLLPEIKKLMPKEYNTYYEVFVGGGALFFELQPKKAVINDFNSELINVYKQIKTSPEMLLYRLETYQNKYNSLANMEKKKEYYYSLRQEYNKLIANNFETIDSASLFIILNKLGFNGLYRVNSNGEYNVPFNFKKKLNAFNKENILNISNLLKKTKILNMDFEKACKTAKKDDFIFFDSPYYDTFDTYQSGGFSKENHIRLADLYNKLTKKGVKCMLTNSNSDFIKDLYKGYNIKVVNVKRNINCDGKRRTGQEVIITNY